MQLVDNIMVLSSKVGLQPNNKGRLESYVTFIHEYQRVAQELVKHLWCELGLEDNPENKIPKYLDHKDVARYDIQTWLGSRVLQNVGKQVLGVLKGEFTKIKKLSYALKLNQKQGRQKVVAKIQKRIGEMSLSCPDCSSLEPQLNANCFKNIRFDREISQICWLTLSSLKAKGSEDGIASIDVCFKLHKHFNSLRDKSKRMMNSIRLGTNYIAFSFEVEGEPLPEGASDKPLGVDIGIKDAFSVSNGTKESALNHPHGWTYEKILNKLTRQKKGSKNFKQTQALRLNYLRWAVKRLGLENNAQIIREDIKDLYRGQRSSRRMKHFNHRIIFEVLDSYCQRHGVHVKTVNQRYTSQRCSSCGYVHHLSRKGKDFKCRACGYTADSDLNASFNLALDLPPLSGEGCKPKASRTRILLARGSKEFIVPWHEEKDMNGIKRHSFINYHFENYFESLPTEYVDGKKNVVCRTIPYNLVFFRDLLEKYGVEMCGKMFSCWTKEGCCTYSHGGRAIILKHWHDVEDGGRDVNVCHSSALYTWFTNILGLDKCSLKIIITDNKQITFRVEKQYGQVAKEETFDVDCYDIAGEPPMFISFRGDC